MPLDWETLRFLTTGICFESLPDVA